MTFSRRQFLLTTTASFAAVALTSPAFAADPIVIGVPTAQSGPVGVADQQDWLNGVTMAVDEINAAGGVNGRPLKTEVVDIDLLTPEGVVAAYQNLVGRNVHAIAHSFNLIVQPAMDVAASTGVPYLHGNTAAQASCGSCRTSGPQAGPQRTTASISCRNRSAIRR